ncbi:MAG: DUF1778 domain-containing protein [Thermomicrobiales bacterium]|jgi:uncharacterized protein (DUF1778 family)
MATIARTARIEARVSPDSLALIRDAANLQGRSISDFVVTAAQEAARKALDEAHVIHLAAEDQARFAEALIDPPSLAPAMERALTEHRRLIRTSED